MRSHLEVVEVLYVSDNVVLQIQNLELAECLADQLDLLDILSVECDLLQVRQQAVVVLGSLQHKRDHDSGSNRKDDSK